MYLKQLLFIIVFQCIMEYVFRTINRCDERLASKGGENTMTLLNFNIKIRLPLLFIPVNAFFSHLKLKPMPLGG